MSYLNSLLSSIGGGDKKPSSPATQEPSRTMSSREATNGASTDSPVARSAAPAKRKAEGDAGPVANKTARKDPSSTAGRPAPKPLSKITTTPAGYQGTARPNSAGPLSAKNKTSAPQPPQSAPLSASATSSAPPKKGSFAEIMARAKAAQESTQPAIGIKHKPVEKSSRKERLLKAQEEAKRKKQESKGARPGQARRSRSPEKVKGASGGFQKRKRVPTDLGYKGTMRPSANTSTYTGRMRPSGSASKTAARSPAKPKEKVRMAGYASYSEHSDDDMHSDDWDDMSDMEAGISDVEEEEMFSLRAAKKEDDEALREENELRRKKVEKKKLTSRR